MISILENESINEILRNAIGIPLILFMFFGMLITFIDFITLSFLYRPLVYTFFDHKFGKRISLLLIPAYLVLIVAATITYEKYNYYFIKI